MSIHIVDKDDFQQRLAEAGETLIVVDFFATWCGPCKMIAPRLEDLAKELGTSVIILKVDVDECEDLATDYNVSSMPTFILIKSTKVVQQFSGANYDKLKTLVIENK